MPFNVHTHIHTRTHARTHTHTHTHTHTCTHTHTYTVPPTFVTQPEAIMDVLEWSEVTLTCSASGNPAPLISWETEGRAQLSVGVQTSVSMTGTTVRQYLWLIEDPHLICTSYNRLLVSWHSVWSAMRTEGGTGVWLIMCRLTQRCPSTLMSESLVSSKNPNLITVQC